MKPSQISVLRFKDGIMFIPSLRSGAKTTPIATKDHKMNDKKNVLVVGAGPAGLTAAYELLKHAGNRFNVILVEENRQVGGLSKTLYYKGNRIDLGGHRFFSKSNAVNELWEELLPMQGAPSWDDRKLERTIPLSPNGLPEPCLTHLLSPEVF